MAYVDNYGVIHSTYRKTPSRVKSKVRSSIFDELTCTEGGPNLSPLPFLYRAVSVSYRPISVPYRNIGTADRLVLRIANHTAPNGGPLSVCNWGTRTVIIHNVYLYTELIFVRHCEPYCYNFGHVTDTLRTRWTPYCT